LCEPIDTFVSIKDPTKKTAAIAMKQQLVPAQAEPWDKWSDGTFATTSHRLGKGMVHADGTLSATAEMKLRLKPIPWARGGRHMVYNPANLSLRRSVALFASAEILPTVDCSKDGIESIVLDHKDGTLLTLVNWTNAKVLDLEVQVRMKDAPKTVRTVSGQRNLAFAVNNGLVTFRLDLAEADYVLLIK
jgi:hypothetical protein